MSTTMLLACVWVGCALGNSCVAYWTGEWERMAFATWMQGLALLVAALALRMPPL